MSKRPLTPTKPLTNTRVRRNLFGSPKKPTQAPVATRPATEQALQKPKSKTVAAQVKQAFYDPNTGLWSADKIYKKLKADGVKVTLKQVEDVVKNQLVTQIYKPQGKYKKRFTTIYAKAPREQYQVDLIDLSKYSKFNRGYKWMFNAVDVHSRYAYSVPTKTKGNDDCVNAFKEIVKVMGAPKNLNTDLEQAILGKEFQALLKKEGVKHWPVNPEKKRTNSIVERFNRTIREVLQKYFYTRDTKNWIDILPNLLTNYNSTEHSTTKAQPIDVWKGDGKSKQMGDLKAGDRVLIYKPSGEGGKTLSKKQYVISVVDGNNVGVKSTDSPATFQLKRADVQKVDPSVSKQVPVKPKFDIKVGDTVRILKRYAEFTKKSDVKKFTKNEYKVIGLEGTTFKLRNSKGTVVERRDYELQKIDSDTVQSETFDRKGEGVEYKKELKKQRATRRLRKEDIATDLVNAAPAGEKRVSKPVVPKQAPKQKKPPVKKQPKFVKGMRVSVQYPDQAYAGVVDEVLLTPRGAIDKVDVDFDDGTSAVFSKKELKLIKILSP